MAPTFDEHLKTSTKKLTAYNEAGAAHRQAFTELVEQFHFLIGKKVSITLEGDGRAEYQTFEKGAWSSWRLRHTLGLELVIDGWIEDVKMDGHVWLHLASQFVSTRLRAEPQPVRYRVRWEVDKVKIASYSKAKRRSAKKKKPRKRKKGS